MLINAIHLHSMKFKNGRHPFRVPSGEVIIHRHQMHTLFSQCIEKHRQRCDQCLAFSCLHFGHLAPMQCRSPNQLDIIMHHVPFHLRSCSQPFVVPNSFISLNRHTCSSCCRITVPICSLDPEFFVLRQTPSCFFDKCKRLSHHLL